jgi:hypothetical protein
MVGHKSMYHCTNKRYDTLNLATKPVNTMPPCISSHFDSFAPQGIISTIHYEPTSYFHYLESSLLLRSLLSQRNHLLRLLHFLLTRTTNLSRFKLLLKFRQGVRDALAEGWENGFRFFDCCSLYQSILLAQPFLYSNCEKYRAG